MAQKPNQSTVEQSKRGISYGSNADDGFSRAQHETHSATTVIEKQIKFADDIVRVDESCSAQAAIGTKQTTTTTTTTVYQTQIRLSPRLEMRMIFSTINNN